MNNRVHNTQRDSKLQTQTDWDDMDNDKKMQNE